MKKRIGVVFFLIALFFAGRSLWFAYHKSQGFSVSKMQASIPFHQEWEVPLPSYDLKAIFKQKFHFLSSGYQSYAFISEDERTIIKFFRMKRLTHSFTDHFFHPKKVREHKKNLLSIFNAYKLAYDEMREDAGLIYIHLNKTKDLKTKLSIVDCSGEEYLIDLDRNHFIVQEKAELLFDQLQQLWVRNEKEKFQQYINMFLEFVKRRVSRGITDADEGISQNYGFVDDRVIQFDIGRISKGKNEEEYNQILNRLNYWMKLNNIFFD